VTIGKTAFLQLKPGLAVYEITNHQLHKTHLSSPVQTRHPLAQTKDGLRLLEYELGQKQQAIALSAKTAAYILEVTAHGTRPFSTADLQTKQEVITGEDEYGGLYSTELARLDHDHSLAAKIDGKWQAPLDAAGN